MKLIPLLRTESLADKDSPRIHPPLQAEAGLALDIHALLESIPRSASGCTRGV
jgi:hypothetical protein